MENYTNFLAGGIAGVFEVSTSHPIDVVKTAMQDKATTAEKVKISPYRYLIDRYKRGGVPHLYRGYVPRVIGIIPMRGLFWGVQSTTYTKLGEYDMNDRSRAMIAGIVGGTAQTLVDNPIEVIKTRMITSAHLDRVQAVPRPVRGYPGFNPTLIRNVGFLITLTQFTTLQENDSYLSRFGLAGAGGFVGSVVTQPVDYVKTQMQSANYDGKQSAMRIFIDTFRKNPKTLMVGAMPRATLSFVNMGVGYLAFSLFLKVFDD